VLLTSGASTYLVGDPFSSAMNSLPLFVFSTVRSGEPIYIQRGFAAATILLVLVLVLFVVARLLARQRTGR
jgi:phosphate transport system permease protein